MKYKRYLFPILMGSTMSCIMSQMNTGKIVFPSILVMMLLQSTVASIVVPFDISVGEEPYYMALTRNDGLTQDELTKLVKVDKAATARMVKSLEQKGYITRETDPKDKRNKKIYLTETGRLQYEPLSDALKKFNQDLTSEWTDEQYEIVYQSLEMLQKRFEFDNK